jgi:hypothetical protein
VFSHAGWREPTEFMSMCSTHWASYLIGLKAGLEGRDYTPYPQGEVNRWAPRQECRNIRVGAPVRVAG